MRLTDRLIRALDRVSKLGTLVGAALCFAMMAVLTVDVILRATLNTAIYGAIELAVFALVLMAFFAQAEAFTAGRHITVDFFIQRAPARVKAVLELVTLTISLAIMAAMSVATILSGLETLEEGEISFTLQLPVGLFKLAAGVGLILLTLAMLRRWLTLVTGGTRDGGTVGMSTITIGILGVVIMLALLMLRMHIGFTMAVVGFVGIYAITGDWYIAFHTLGTVPYSSVATFLLIAVPLFTLMGRFAYHSGISADLYATASTWLRHLPGGLAVATVGACAMFSAVSGSSLAAAASMGAIAIPEMLRHKIDPRLATGVVAAGGTLGIMIPPSLGFIIYGLIAEESIGTLLIAGILPGIILSVAFMIVAMTWAAFSPHMSTRQEPATWGERFRSLGGVWGILVLFALVMGGIYGGFMTPTEAAAIGAAGSLLLLVLRKGWSLPQIGESLRETTAITAMIFMILIGAHVFNVFLALSRLPTSITDFVVALELSPILILLVVFAGYVVLGCFLDTLAMIVLTVPILLPAIQVMGYDPIWFGVMIVMVMEMGMITPPVGLIVYVIKGVMPEIELRHIFVGVWPFVAAQVVILLLFLFWPDVTLWLPNLMRG